MGQINEAVREPDTVRYRSVGTSSMQADKAARLAGATRICRGTAPRYYGAANPDHHDTQRTGSPFTPVRCAPMPRPRQRGRRAAEKSNIAPVYKRQDGESLPAPLRSDRQETAQSRAGCVRGLLRPKQFAAPFPTRSAATPALAPRLWLWQSDTFGNLAPPVARRTGHAQPAHPMFGGRRCVRMHG